MMSLAPCGASGLKYDKRELPELAACLAPCGASGLKCERGAGEPLPVMPSRPVRGEWIEIACGRVHLRAAMRSRPVRGEWIEMVFNDVNINLISLAPCGASGLKSHRQRHAGAPDGVSPRAGRVD